MRMSEGERARAVSLLKMAYQLISIMPGVPCIFYGDEAGMEGYGDPFCRRPVPWGREELDLTDFYRQVGGIHRNTPVLRDGYVRLLRCTENHVAVLRYNGKDPSMLLILNRRDVFIRVRMSEMASDMDSEVYGSVFDIPPASGRYYLLSSTDGEVTVTIEEM